MLIARNQGPWTPSSLWVHVLQGCYVGSPNIARCRAGDERECQFTAMHELEDSNNPKVCAPDAMLSSALGGPMEFNSWVFGGVYYGRIFVPTYKRYMVWYNPEEGKSVQDTQDSFYPSSPSLDVVHAPGGVHLAASIEASEILINYPVDADMAAHRNPSLYDIVPNKALRAQQGRNTFVIGGAHFDAITGALVRGSAWSPWSAQCALQRRPVRGPARCNPS